MKKKQILAALLATTCAVSMAVPTFAADDEDPVLGEVVNEEDKGIDDLKDWQLEVGTSVQNPTLKVTLPKSTSVLVNPYRIEVDTDGEEGSETSYDTVLSPVMDIVNNSGCAIKVGVKGMLQTYTVVAGTAEALPDTTATDSQTPAKPLYTVTNKTDLELADLKVVKSADGKTGIIVKEATVNGTTELRQVGTFKEVVMNATDNTKVGSAGQVNITGYVVSKDIKVATTALKDVDAEKTNSLFIYVEGKQEDGEWAAAFDAKAIAGVVDTKTKVMATTGMMALTAKETTQNILYLGSGKTGNVRVTGQAATAPTKAWMTLTDTFETPFTFVIDAVANEAPKAPTVTDITLTPSVGTVTGYTFAAATNEYTVEWTSAARNKALAFAVVGADPSDATVSYSASGAGITASSLSWDADANELLVDVATIPASGLVADVTVKLTNKGVSTTYVYHVTVKP